jgi:hypothetical protein
LRPVSVIRGGVRFCCERTPISIEQMATMLDNPDFQVL